MEVLLAALLKDSGDLAAKVDDRINPDSPPQDESLSYLVYQVDAQDQSTALDGGGRLEHGEITLEWWTKKKIDAIAIGDVVKALLHKHRAGPIRGIFFRGRQTLEEERGFHGLMTFGYSYRP